MIKTLKESIKNAIKESHKKKDAYADVSYDKHQRLWCVCLIDRNTGEVLGDYQYALNKKEAMEIKKDIENDKDYYSNYNLEEAFDRDRNLLYISPSYSANPKSNATRFYHQTMKSNINSIIENGLLTNKAKWYDNPGKVIWLTDDINDNWNYGDALVEIDLPNDFEDIRKVNNSEYNVYSNIPKEYINAIYLKSPYRKEIMRDFNNTLDIDKSIERFRNGELDEALKVDGLKKATAYMLRNDGALFECEIMHPYIKYAYEFDDMENLITLFEHPDFVEFFYENTNSEETRNNIVILLQLTSLLQDKLDDKVNRENIVRLLNKYNINPNDFNGNYDLELLYNVFNVLNVDTNQEFCRVRTSNMKFGGTSGATYFRISSVHFNWFNLIWSLVAKNVKFISDVTICKDAQTFGGKVEFYNVKGVQLNHIPTNEFLTLSGNPLIKNYKSKLSIIDNAFNLLNCGKTITESYDNIHHKYVMGYYNNDVKNGLVWDFNNILSRTTNETLTTKETTQLEQIDNLIDDLYKLRQGSIEKDGEFGIGNLVFKEFRNMGYLDNLKDLKVQLQSKEMSLENLEE